MSGHWYHNADGLMRLDGPEEPLPGDSADEPDAEDGELPACPSAWAAS